MTSQVKDRAPALLEREGEVGLFETILARTRAGEGGVVVVEGQAGVGKTQLLRTAADLGQAAGFRTLRGRGSELDRAFAFGVVRQLLERDVADAPDLLTGGAEPAGAVFASSGYEARPEDGLFSSLQGLYWLVANLAAGGPLLLLADDVHWADTPSLRWLAFLAERIEEIPVLLAAGTRLAEPGADQDLLDALRDSPATTVVRPAPLSSEATMTVVRDRLPGAVEAFGAACHRATGGNPFLLGELLGELAAESVHGTAGEAGQVLDFGSERVGRAVRRRLRLLPSEATSVARAVAVLGPRAPLEEAATLAGVDAGSAAGAADALVGVDILDADLALDFVHPVVRSAVYDLIPPLECQALHVQAAHMLTKHGAEAERVARHLLRLPPAAEPERVALLRTAGRDALARGAAEPAAQYLRRALDEPPSEDERGAVLFELGIAEATDRHRDRFVGALREAMAVTEEPETRARIALALGRSLGSDGDFHLAVEVLDEALGGLDDSEGELAVAIEAELLALSFLTFPWTEPIMARRERRLAQLAAGDSLEASTLAALVMPTVAARPPAANALQLIDRVLGASELEGFNTLLAGSVGTGLIYAGTPAGGARFYERGIRAATERGGRLAVAWQLVMRSEASLRLGEVRRADAEARTGFEFVEEGTGDTGMAWTIAHLTSALVARGALDEADELLASAPLGPDARPSLGLAEFHIARANLHLAQARPGAALSDARTVGEMVAGKISNPEGCRWRSPAALALAALGSGAEARAMAEDELADARRFAIPDAEGAALRTLGLVTGGAEGADLLRSSVSVLERAEGRLERMRSLLELGAALRRAGGRAEAKEVLREALDALARAGATGLADRAHEELVAAGARPRRDRRMLSGRESLTASEDRTAALAAEGLTNREIAQRQFVTVKAVQFHLSNVYRKLDIGSREELPEALDLEA